MGRVYMTVGRYASSPFTIKKACINVYCVEELCYYIRNNAFLIDDDFFSHELFSWLEEECALPDLAKGLRMKARQERTNEAVAGFLLESTCYCTREETEETKELLAANRNMPKKQKLKLRADFFLRNGRLSLAFHTYEDLLFCLDDINDRPELAKVYHNMGVIYAKMFLYSEARHLFEKAYELDGRDEYIFAILAAYRMDLSDEAYLKKISTLGNEFMGETGRLENILDELKDKFPGSDDYLKFTGICSLKESAGVREYNQQMAQQLIYFKENYRNGLQQ